MVDVETERDALSRVLVEKDDEIRRLGSENARLDSEVRVAHAQVDGLKKDRVRRDAQETHRRNEELERARARTGERARDEALAREVATQLVAAWRAAYDAYLALPLEPSSAPTAAALRCALASLEAMGRNELLHRAPLPNKSPWTDALVNAGLLPIVAMAAVAYGVTRPATAESAAGAPQPAATP